MGPVLSKVHLQIIQLMGTTHRRTTKKMVVKNTVKLKKTRGIPLAHPLSREKGTSFHTNHWGKKGSSWRQMMKLWKSWEKFAKDSIVKIIKQTQKIDMHLLLLMTYEVYPKKKSLWLSWRYEMLYINFKWRSLIHQKVTKIVAIIISIIPLPLKVHFEWTITVTFRAPFDPLEIVITFLYQQITLLVTKRRMGTISTKICKEIFYSCL